MAREIVVVTPENIPLRMELAGLGSRFGALLLDLVVMAAVLVPLWLIVFPISAALARADSGLMSLVLACFLIATLSAILRPFYRLRVPLERPDAWKARARPSRHRRRRFSCHALSIRDPELASHRRLPAHGLYRRRDLRVLQQGVQALRGCRGGNGGDQRKGSSPRGRRPRRSRPPHARKTLGWRRRCLTRKSI